MKSLLKPLALAALFTTSVGLLTFTSGCAGTPTRESTGEYIDDSTITVKVKADFVNDPVVSVFDIQVETFKGVVQLSGFVATAEEKARAARLAGSVRGVTEVRNNITIK